jgi:CRISPR-associated protein Cmr4
VITRIKIDPKTGTVQEGALFSEEYLPQESVLYSLALATPIFVKNDEAKGIFKQNGKKEEELVLDFFKLGLPEIIQIGGNATIGKGIVRIKVREVQNE